MSIIYVNGGYKSSSNISHVLKINELQDERIEKLELILEGSEGNIDSTVVNIVNTHTEQLSELNTDISEIENTLSSKVDKVSGKQLSTNDFTNELKTKLENSNVYKHQFRALSALPDNGDGWYSIASIGDTESSIVQISSSGHTDVQVAINTGWAGNTTGSLTILNSFIDDTNGNHAFVKAVRLRKIPNSSNGTAVLEAKINRTGYYNYSLYVNIIVSAFTNAGHNIITTDSEHAQTLLLVNDDSNILQEFTLTDKAIMAKNIVAETITADNLAPVATSGSFEDLSDKPTYTWSDVFDTTRTVPNLDFDATGNNANTYGYIGNLSKLGIEGDNVLIDSISVYVREGNRSPNLTTQVWCRLLRFKNEAWEIVYESTESKTINDIAPETLFPFKMRNVIPDCFIKATDKIAIVYANDQADVLSSTHLGFKVIEGILGCMSAALTNSSTGAANFIPAFVIDYVAFGLDFSTPATTLRRFNAGIDINGKSTITSDVDSGELKVLHNNSTKGFIIKTVNGSQSILPLLLISTNGSNYYTYSFPEKSGTVALTDDLNSKQNTLVSGTNIKTINNQSILGSGDITIQGDGIPEVLDKEIYYNDGSNEVVPIKHPDLSTQPSILPYKFMGQYVYEQLIPVKVGDRIVDCNFEVKYPMILSAGVFGVNSFKNIDIIATKSDALLLDSESELGGYINVKYTDASQLLPSNGYGYEDNNTRLSTLIDFGLLSDGTIYAYDPNTETLSLYGPGEITQNSIPQNIPIKNIIFGDDVTNIGFRAFANCSSLTSITIPESVTSIENSAFYNCSNLQSIVFEEGSQLKTIGNLAFNSCDNLASINIPESVTSIGNEAFRGCSNLTSITIPESSQLKSIGEQAFLACRSLSSINISESVTKIGASAFASCDNLTSITIPENSQLKNIGNAAFNGCNITSITIPESVTSIGEYAFGECRSLTTINIPEESQLTSIGSSAFSSCDLTFINIPKSVTSIGDNAFYSCNNITSITVAENNTIYDSRGNCNAIIETNSNTLILGCSTTVIPSSVTSIGSSAFRECRSLTTINIPDGTISIGDSAFANCSGITSINIPESVTSIRDAAFANCSGITSITIPENSQLASIGSSAFSGCKYTSINIPKGVTSIGNNVFYGCYNLTSVTIPENSQLTSIGEAAFSGCSSLTAINIPQGVTSIKYGTFQNCRSLTTINIPEGVTSIGNSAFAYCSSLTSITCKAITPPSVSTNTFNSVSKSIPVYVQAKSVNTYKAANYWKDFTNIQAI